MADLSDPCIEDMPNPHLRTGNGGSPAGVLLLNFGGPETLADVRPFLFNLFSDPGIIRIRNDRLRRLIAWMIASTRQRKSRALYRQIGGGSPLRRITIAQAEALGAALAARGCSARMYVGMRLWKPPIEEAVAQIAADGIRRLVVLPLFPQHSVTTSGSCLEYFRAIAERTGLDRGTEIVCVDPWYTEPLYLDAMADMIREAQHRFSGQAPEGIHILYSAHSIPVRYVQEGDPYQKQTEATVALINQRLENRFPSILAYQSKVGPLAWLGPATKDTIADLGRRGVSKLLPVPISFISDHIETLQEIDILYRDLAARAGIREFHRAASLNVYPKFIEALAKLCSCRVSSR
jgi:protoporphyrin/coproporphyrin ferrochelatase